MEPTVPCPPIIWMETVDSTNSELRRRIRGLDNLSIIAAREQTAGRGQGTHSWYSVPEDGLSFSILYRFGEPFALAVGDVILITQLTTLALRDYLLGFGVEARIKWPNDIWVGERKLCGILIENTLEEGFVRESIVGIGLNLNGTQWPPELPNPVSLEELTGFRRQIRTELPPIQQAICRRFGQLASPDGRRSLQEEFGKYLFRLP